ncbi:MAG: methyltransferase domain-containing protein [Comamonas sp.]
MHHWLDSPTGRYLLDWEQQRCDEAVADVFGYHSLQLGLPMLQGLRANRMPHRWLALQSCAEAAAWTGSIPAPGGVREPAHAVLEPSALPFAEASLDLLVLPHTLENTPDPHGALREVARVLVPEGRVVICGINPASWWGMQSALTPRGTHLPDVRSAIGYWRLRDWLRLLALDVQAVEFGCHRPAVQSAQWHQRWGWMDPLGERAWPILGGVYCVVATKRVAGMRLLEPAWRQRPQPAAAAAAAPLAHRGGIGRHSHQKI